MVDDPWVFIFSDDVGFEIGCYSGYWITTGGSGSSRLNQGYMLMLWVLILIFRCERLEVGLAFQACCWDHSGPPPSISERYQDKRCHRIEVFDGP